MMLFAVVVELQAADVAGQLRAGCHHISATAGAVC